MRLDEIASLVERYKYGSTEELEEIKFRLELPYKVLDLLVEASQENIEIKLTKFEDTFDLYLANKDNKYNNSYLLMSNCSPADLHDCLHLVDTIRSKRLEVERLAALKEEALSKLTKEEKEVLGLIQYG